MDILVHRVLPVQLHKVTLITSLSQIKFLKRGENRVYFIDLCLCVSPFDILFLLFFCQYDMTGIVPCLQKIY